MGFLTYGQKLGEHGPNKLGIIINRVRNMSNYSTMILTKPIKTCPLTFLQTVVYLLINFYSCSTEAQLM